MFLDSNEFIIHDSADKSLKKEIYFKYVLIFFNLIFICILMGLT